jgi:hypothetical protein
MFLENDVVPEVYFEGSVKASTFHGAGAALPNNPRCFSIPMPIKLSHVLSVNYLTASQTVGAIPAD